MHATADPTVACTHPDDFERYEPMDVATFELLGEQLELARQVTLRYPSVADALAAGFVRRGAFVPGQGAHYFPGPGAGSQGSSAIEHPLSWLYAGVEPTPPVVGLMYGGNIDFAGPNDRFPYQPMYVSRPGRIRPAASRRSRSPRASP